MKKNIMFFLTVIGLIICTIGLLMNFSDSKVSDKNNKYVNYKCTVGQQINSDGSIMEQIYEFQYLDTVINPVRKVVVIFNNIDYYNNLGSFEEDGKFTPDETYEDSNKLTKTYIWKSAFGNEDNYKDIETYLEFLSNLNYKCVIE